MADVIADVYEDPDIVPADVSIYCHLADNAGKTPTVTSDLVREISAAVNIEDTGVINGIKRLTAAGHITPTAPVP